MNTLALHLLLALLWAAVLGSFDALTLVSGFGVALLVAGPLAGRPGFARRCVGALAFAALYLWELVASSLAVARVVLRPRLALRPAIFGLPLKARSDAEITVLANLISLTPGTLSLEVSEDREVLWIHAMDVADVDQLADDLQRTIERRVLTLMRPTPAEEASP